MWAAVVRLGVGSFAKWCLDGIGRLGAQCRLRIEKSRHTSKAKDSDGF